MPSTTDRPQFCRDHALECARLAERALSLEAKINFLELERRWIYAAEQEIDPTRLGN
jgi:hypothetical protein